MKTFQQFLSEAESRFRVSIHPQLAGLLEDIFEAKGYEYRKENNTFILTLNTTANKLIDTIYASLNAAFVDGNKTLIKFVGSDLIGDFIDADFSLNVEALYS